jgi:ATP-dependent DNA ligase
MLQFIPLMFQRFPTAHGTSVRHDRDMDGKRVSSYIGLHVVACGNSRGRPLNAPAAFIHPCRPMVTTRPPSGPGWAHELKHDGYRLQIHVRDGRVKLYTITGADWSKRYPRIVEAAGRIGGNVILDAEVVWLGLDGVPDFDALHIRVNDKKPLPSLSICSHLMVTTFRENLFQNARRLSLS